MTEPNYFDACAANASCFARNDELEHRQTVLQKLSRKFCFVYPRKRVSGPKSEPVWANKF